MILSFIWLVFHISLLVVFKIVMSNSMGGVIDMLPEDCVSTILSFTSPTDTFRSSMVSSTFRSAAESDFVWERFLLADYKDVVSRLDTPLTYTAMKELFHCLCNPVLIDGGRKVGLNFEMIHYFQIHTLKLSCINYWCVYVWIELLLMDFWSLYKAKKKDLLNWPFWLFLGLFFCAHI